MQGPKKGGGGVEKKIKNKGFRLLPLPPYALSKGKSNFPLSFPHSGLEQVRAYSAREATPPTSTLFLSLSSTIAKVIFLHVKGQDGDFEYF